MKDIRKLIQLYRRLYSIFATINIPEIFIEYAEINFFGEISRRKDFWIKMEGFAVQGKERIIRDREQSFYKITNFS